LNRSFNSLRCPPIAARPRLVSVVVGCHSVDTSVETDETDPAGKTYGIELSQGTADDVMFAVWKN
jgi:hypothetical protein